MFNAVKNVCVKFCMCFIDILACIHLQTKQFLKLPQEVVLEKKHSNLKIQTMLCKVLLVKVDALSVYLSIYLEPTPKSKRSMTLFHHGDVAFPNKDETAWQTDSLFSINNHLFAFRVVFYFIYVCVELKTDEFAWGMKDLFKIKRASKRHHFRKSCFH